MEDRRYHPPHFTQKDTDAAHALKSSSLNPAFFLLQEAHGICVVLLTEYLNAPIYMHPYAIPTKMCQGGDGVYHFPR